MKNDPNCIFCLIRFKITQNTKLTFHKCPKTLQFLPKWPNSGKFGRTDDEERKKEASVVKG